MGILQHLIAVRARKLQALDEPDLHDYGTPARPTPTEQIDMRIPYNHLDCRYMSTILFEYLANTVQMSGAPKGETSVGTGFPGWNQIV